MKYFVSLLITILFFTSCKKEDISIAEKHSDDYTIEWIEINLDSVERLNNNDYQLLELLILKDKNKDTLKNQIRFYSDGQLDNRYSQYYDLIVESTDKKHIYLAKIKLHSEYSNLPVRERYADFFFLNFYQDSTSVETKNFDNIDEFEIEFINFHNDRFEGVVTEHFIRDTIINNVNDKVNMRTIETVITNKKNMAGLFIENGSFFNERKISLKGYKRLTQ